MSANIAKNRKYNKDFSCQLKTPVTYMAKTSKITNIAKFYEEDDDYSEDESVEDGYYVFEDN